MKVSLLLHIILVSLILLLSAVLNSYTITVLSKRIATEREVLRRTTWVEDSIKYMRFSLPCILPNYEETPKEKHKKGKDSGE